MSLTRRWRDPMRFSEAYDPEPPERPSSYEYMDWLDDQAEDLLLREEEPEDNIPEAVMDRLPEPEEEYERTE